MAIKITEECINCGACEPECPNNAIYAGGAEWRLSDKTAVSGTFTTKSGLTLEADAPQEALSADLYYIVPEDFMTSPSVPLFARLIAAFRMRPLWNQRKNYLRRKLLFTEPDFLKFHFILPPTNRGFFYFSNYPFPDSHKFQFLPLSKI
jgi:ferredoxin